MKQQAKKNVSFTFILPYTQEKSDFPLYQNLGGGAQLFFQSSKYFRFVSAC